MAKLCISLASKDRRGERIGGRREGGRGGIAPLVAVGVALGSDLYPILEHHKRRHIGSIIYNIYVFQDHLLDNKLQQKSYSGSGLKG
jgi:hypothetical protein